MRRLLLPTLLMIIIVSATASAIMETSITINSGGRIGTLPTLDLDSPFGIRIADMMTDLLQPNFDDKWYSTYWVDALADLKEASPNGEINTVQMRIWWMVDADDRSSWEYPELGTLDSGQIPFSQNWERWGFGDGDDLPYGPCAAERIHDAGFRMEFCLSGAWTPNAGMPSDIISVWQWGGREADAPDYPFDGDLFLLNYKNNVVLPVANFLASSPNFLDGDIFCMSFEMSYPDADFTWLHNDAWNSIISEVRQIFADAGKPNVLLTVDCASWGGYSDYGMGYEAAKMINPDAPITSDYPGFGGQKYLSNLDFISVSYWNPVLVASEMPDSWTGSESEIQMVTDHWFNNSEYNKVGTGYAGVLAEPGRDMIQDYRVMSQLLGKKILFNTGWVNKYGRLAWTTFWPPSEADNTEQMVAWTAQLRALSDPRSQMETWCAGQDFERYCRDKAAQPEYIESSWRKTPAEAAIVSEIQTILASLT